MLRIRLQHSSKTYSVDKVAFVVEGKKGYFELTSDIESTLAVRVNYNLPVHDEYDEENFRCHPFASPVFYKESSILQVNVRDKKIGRIGWMFTIQSLVSDQHDFAADPHFLKYAYVTTFKLLKGDLFDIDIVVDVQSLQEDKELTDIYLPELSVLTTSLQKTNLLTDFEIRAYYHSLYVNRFYPFDTQTEVSALRRISNTDLPPGAIIIDEISFLLKDELFICSLFHSNLKLDNHPLVQFHLLYQIIELLINRVMSNEVNNMLFLANNGLLSNDRVSSKMKKLPGEDYRISLIFSSYLSKQPVSGPALISSCNSLINHFEGRQKELKDAIYKTRNIIVHNYRKVTSLSDSELVIRTINNDFENVISEMLTNYIEIPASQNIMQEPLAWQLYQLSLE